MNNVRRALKEFYSLCKNEPVPMLGQDMFKILYGSTYKFDKANLAGEIHALTEKIQKEYEENPNKYPKAPRILVTGCPIGGGAEKCIKAIEDNGGHVVVFENCSGAKSCDREVDENESGHLRSNRRTLPEHRLFGYDSKPKSSGAA